MTLPSKLDPSIEHLPTKAAKIRALAEQGYPRAEIARVLNVRYQHVRNVLEQDKVRRSGRATADQSLRHGDDVVPSKLRLGPDGRVLIPAAFRDALGLKQGGLLFAKLENGEVHLLTPAAAMRRAQALVRSLATSKASLVEELLAERRREAARETGDG
jgi:bifunctional DNA-binding transcriptional regulator/antitoxin component of YhaV-PrlF toxin-antitoxin module